MCGSRRLRGIEFLLGLSPFFRGGGEADNGRGFRLIISDEIPWQALERNSVMTLESCSRAPNEAFYGV